MARRPRPPGNLDPTYVGYGIGEWYGSVLRNLNVAERNARGHNPRVPPLQGRWPCPFTTSFDDAAPRRGKQANLTCTKPGGVCSLRSFFTLPDDGNEEVPAGFGPLTCTCPYRFVQDGTAFNRIAADVLGVAAGQYHYVKEVGFLQRVPSPMRFPEQQFGMVGMNAAEAAQAAPAPQADAAQPAAIDDPENVGRIDTLLVDMNDPTNWCAVELQAVYFSGKEMPPDIAALTVQEDPGAGANAPLPLPLPAGNRRPDFRSSGPKRLLPQLQIKVPSLRRWGKKMVVVVDAPFFNSLGPMEEAGHISNSDIVWCVVDYQETEEDVLAPLYVRGMVSTTLESAIVGLTAGRPVTKPTFEERIIQKL